MEFLPTTLGTRPRLAVELRPEGLVAARAEDAAGLLAAVSRARLADGVVTAGLKAGNIGNHAAVVAAFRKVMEAVVDKANSRSREVTLIVPDAAARVLLLEFDSLPAKAVEALPVVRFRLKKMLPFEAEDAAVSYQVMSTTKSLMRVLAVAMPREVLAEYEAVVREAGFEPGAILPSTLAALAGLDVSEAAALVVNAGPKGVTTAIVQSGVLLLHRSVDMTTEEPYVESAVSLPLVDREDSMQEWAQQHPVPIGATAEAEAAREAALAESNAVLEGVREEMRELDQTSGVREVAQAVSVAAAYFEDTLGLPPGAVLSAGITGSEALGGMLREAGFGGQEMRVREMVAAEMLGAGASTATVPRCWMAGVRGALKN